MTFSKSTLELLYNLLMGSNIPASSPDFDEIAAHVSLARKELVAALATDE